MAKASSWLTVVKRAFRSPTKDSTERKSFRERDENRAHEQDDHNKKREKRRWLFRKATDLHVKQISSEQKIGAKAKSDDRIEIKDIISSPVAEVVPSEQRRAIAVATAEAAALTARAAVEIVRLTTRSNNIYKENYNAAIVIQTAFRGYLARRALRALKGLVKLQALVRGQNVRKQAKLTLKCMQALVRAQDHVNQQRARLSLESRRKSMLAETSSTLWDCSTYLHDIRDRVSISREMSCGEVDDCPQTSEEIAAKLQVRKEAALRRERALAYALSNQVRRARRSPSAGTEEEIEERTKWLDRWMATKQWESDLTDTPSAERRDQNIRTIQVDTFGPHSSYCSAQIPYQAQKAQLVDPHSGPNFPYSPLHKMTQQNLYFPVTPSPSKPKALKVRSASPRCLKEERCYSATHTPSMSRYGLGSTGSAVPNYMAATESTKARAQPNSTPRQRPSTPERDQLGRGQSGSARKRLSYNAMVEPQHGNIGVGFGYSNFGQHLRSPSFKSLQSGYVYGIESLSSCYDESTFVRDVSPCSTTDLRWLK